jgi:hypothetical protein
LDDEVFVLMKLLDRGGWNAHETAAIDRAIQTRSEQVRAGLTSPTSRYWTDKIRREIDDRCRLRWDFTNGWTIDRWASGRWIVAGVLGFHTISEYVSIQCDKDNADYTDLIDYLRAKDMQKWASPQHYLEYKRARARRRQRLNWQLGNERLAAIIDRMSDAQIKEFIMVERAMQTGDTVTMHGETKAIYDRLAAASRNTPRPPTGQASQAINPGMHPFIYKRKTGGAHRLER